MTTFSTRQVIVYCLASVVLTVAILAVFRVVFWPGVRAELGLIPRACYSDWPVPLELDKSMAQDQVRQRLEGMIAQRDSALSQDEQDSLRRLLLWMHANQEIYKNMFWLGIPVLKTPSDMWMMQQVLAEVRPDYIVEAGTWAGGSALYFAHVLEGLGLDRSKVITIDIEDMTDGVSKQPVWQRKVEFIHGSSTDPAVVERITNKVRGKRVLVVLDSLHNADHVARELELYSPLVTPGSYLIVEDTNLDGVPMIPDWDGPARAVKDFLATDRGAGFEADISREAFLITLHPGGWLKKK